MSLKLWHGSKQFIEQMDPEKTIDGGVHLGTHAQASMRNNTYLYEIQVTFSNVKRIKDQPLGMRHQIDKARKAGYDALVYLNRYEGMTNERIEALAKSGDLPRLDNLSDREFSKLVPEAADSYVLLDKLGMEILQTISLQKER